MSHKKPWIKAIDTEYNGMVFRSRLEARWAVFFDAAGIKYEYEPEGFEYHGYRYLPDFYLPELDTYVEVKPDRDGFENDVIKASRLIYWGGPIKRLVFLGNIPGPCQDGGLWHFPCLYFSTRDYGWEGIGIAVGWFSFSDDYLTVKYTTDTPTKCTGEIDDRKLPSPFAIHGNYSLSSQKWEPDPHNSGNLRICPDISLSATSFPLDEAYGEPFTPEEMEALNPCTYAAYKKARCARFEFQRTHTK